MREIALHILDIVQNSVSAGASLIEVLIEEDEKKDTFTVTVKDNGRGMDKEFLEAVTDPFTTSRSTRKVGLGIPLFKLAAENTGGSFKIESEIGCGTALCADFVRSSIDRQPLGDIEGTMLTLITSYESIDFLYRHSVNEKSFELDTRKIKEILNGISLSSPDVYLWLKDFLEEGERELN